ncbi:porin family protein [Lacinutrix jangbogonensis]|uniref:porin family protein n=1 Tax=Lacinutrix jangbogonensis TaxID=1469557 RepID=UPI00053D9674|nr:porin family protein [Lacinutrix jangbogonensis]
MKKITLLLLLFTAVAFSQENFIPGTVTSMDGSIKTGMINYQDWKIIPDEIEFKVNENIEKLSPKDILEFEVEDDKFISREVTLDVTEQNLQRLTRSHKAEFKNTRVFLNVLQLGEVSLYEYYDSRPHYFAEKGDVFMELTNRILIDFKTGDISKNRKYLGELNVFLSDCSSFKISNNLEYKRKSLSNIVGKYNMCTGTSVPKDNYTKDLSSKKGKFYATAGANFSTFTVESIRFYAKDFKGSSSVNPFVGLAYEFLLTKNRQKWSLYTEATYNKYSLSEKNEKKNLFRTYDPFELEFSTINVNILFRYKFLTKSEITSPFLNFGIGRSFVVSQNNVVTETTFSSGQQKEFEFEFDNPSQFNYIIGAGITHSNYGLELRYTLFDKLTKVSNETSKLSNLSLVFSYKIL